MRTLVIAVLVMGSSNVALSQTTLSLTGRTYAAAAAPRAIAIADFNNDGWLDIATAGTGRDSIAIVLSVGPNRTFFTLPYRVVGGGPFDMVAGDLNRDGIPDLAIANADADAVDLLLGAGDGTFPTSTRISMAGANPRGLAIADFNGDGNLDVIVTEFATGAWRILYGNGAGGISRQDRFGSIKNPQGVATGDFNHDGRLDVAIAGAGINLVAVFYSQPNGGLVQKNVLVGAPVNVLAAGDFNHDGWPDLAAASTSNSTIYTLLGGASGLALTGAIQSGSSPRDLLAVDMNKDGWLDLVTANRASSTVNVHLGNRLQPGTFLPVQTFAAGDGSRGLGAGDFDHDGTIDLATVNEFGNSVSVLKNTTAFVTPAFRFGLQQFGGPGIDSGFTSQIAVADFDRDGRLDVASVNGAGLSVWPAGRAAVTLDSEPRMDVAVGDFNGDGAPDLVAPDFWGQAMLVFLNHGDGTFTTGLPVAAPQFVFKVETADLNRDGKADIVFEYYHEERDEAFLGVLLGHGDGTFVRAGTTETMIRGSGKMVLADLNGDGKLDIATSGITVWYGKGDGTPSQVVSYDTGYGGGGSLAAADLNEDGRLDLISINILAPIVVLLAQPGGGFSVAHEYPSTLKNPDTTFVYGINVGDMNLDGHMDVITADADILYGDGTGALALTPQSAFEWNGNSPLVADYTRDGLPDMLFAQNGGFTLMPNVRGGTNHAPALNPLPDLTFTKVDFEILHTAINAVAFDPDLHELRYEWRDGDGNLVSSEASYVPPQLPLGQHIFTVTVDDGRGGRVSDSMVLTVTPYEEITLYSDRATELGASWQFEPEDPSAAGNLRLRHPDAGAPKVLQPLANPTNYVQFTFPADATQAYKLWMRLKADNDYWGNDSVYVQFDGAVDADGHSVYQIGTTSALAINLEECSGCGLSGWGWADDGWGAKDLTSKTLLRFPSGQGTIKIQTREDGVSFDQITLSSKKYLTTRPGMAKNDTTILPVTVPRNWRFNP